MKKICSVFVILIATIVAGKAQFFVEGSAQVSYRDDGGEGFNNYSHFAVNISPKAGYWLNDLIAVGTKVSYSLDKAKFGIENPKFPEVSEDIRSEYGLSVFARYKISLPKSFSLLFENSLGVRRLIQKEKTDAVTRKLGHTSFTDVVIFPAISYDLSERFTIVTSCEFLNFGLYFANTKDEDTGQKRHNNRIGFNAQSTVFSSLSNINLGFIYHF